MYNATICTYYHAYLLVNFYSCIPVIYSTNTATGLDMVVDGEGKNMPTILLPTGQKYKHDGYIFISKSIIDTEFNITS